MIVTVVMSVTDRLRLVATVVSALAVDLQMAVPMIGKLIFPHHMSEIC